jgi:N6-L-threonylcarbamoyladenine synthase
MDKLVLAARETGISEIALAGGVSANSGLRKAMEVNGRKEGWNIFIPDFQFTTDNAAMIAIAGYFKYLNKDFASQDIAPYARSTF